MLQAQKGEGSSFFWGGIYEANDDLFKGFKWVLGDGENINIFTDQWLMGNKIIELKIIKYIGTVLIKFVSISVQTLRSGT